MVSCRIKYKIKVSHLISEKVWISEEFDEDKNDEDSMYHILRYAEGLATLNFDDSTGKELILLKKDILKDCVITLIISK